MKDEVQADSSLNSRLSIKQGRGWQGAWLISFFRIDGKWRWRRLMLFSVLVGLVFELGFLLWIWPDWSALREGKVPESSIMKNYAEQREANPKLPAIRWTPVQKPLPQNIKRAFILSEDSRFYEHGGIDFEAIRDAMKYNWKHKKIALGASTISQQTAKNMFLSLSRNPIRKFQELLLTFLLEAKLSKAQILHIYLNIAEFGPGIYGIEAAARNYYRTSAYNLSSMQAGELAASLPSPKKHNPRTRTRFFNRHVARLSRALRMADQFAAQSKARSGKSEAEISAELAQKLQQLRELNADDAESSAASNSDELTNTESADTEAATAATSSEGQDSPELDVPIEKEPAAALPTTDDTPPTSPAPSANLPLLE